ncbi:glycosyl hydrolase [Gaoshiqia sp. Z1-71]|uniref:glycosyl hydrolase n=1 Tax=Gaoshiqia hydrogeniformans TaxID=3290090 RepID=UPI003BF7DE0E
MKTRLITLLLLCVAGLHHCIQPHNGKNSRSTITLEDMKKLFVNPPDSVRPGVYWYFMDGNLSREAMTADLESMKEAGIGNVLFLEVNVGVPRGKVDFLSDEWQELFAHAMKESKRLGITLTLGVGPGWTGSGGPWVKAEESMRHLVSSSVELRGPSVQKVILPKPSPQRPFFGEGTLTPELREHRDAYYQDVAVLAYPTPKSAVKITNIDEKALFVRAPYTSMAGVKPYLPEPGYPTDEVGQAAVDLATIIDLSSKLQADGTLEWKVPEGEWTVIRLGMRNNGAVTRPAPYPGIGFECDKFDTVAFKNHFDAFIGKLFAKSDFTKASKDGGLFRLHMDSWEMGAQNWSDHFRDEFKARRAYDPLPFFPVYSGQVVGSVDQSERFLWDLRLTAQELVLENHAGYIKKMARRYGLDLSIQPYDMNPCADLDLGAVADVPSCEFWLKGLGFNSSFGCIEATSIAHVMGRPVVAAEAFTADYGREGFTACPATLKNQGDWAFATGINKLIYHTFAHKSLGEHYRPGMTMGPYGVHWDRGQTWWPMVQDYHKYISRCSFVLQQGQTVADVLYLTPEGAPHVFRPPHSAMEGNDTIPDRKGYNFDGCSPLMLANASVENHKIVFPGGASYHLLVLPAQKTMTPELLAKIEELVRAGARVTGPPPVKSPSLTNYPDCDKQVRETAGQIWGSVIPPAQVTSRGYGKGQIYWGGSLSEFVNRELYPVCEATAALLKEIGVNEDFQSNGPVRYTHKHLDQAEVYFVANREEEKISADCIFRTDEGTVELWNPLTGETRELKEFIRENGYTTVPLEFDAYQSYFVVFNGNQAVGKLSEAKNFNAVNPVQNLEGSWNVSFDPKWGGPETAIFHTLEDWSKRQEEGIRFYSGIATYQQQFTFDSFKPNNKFYLHLGEVKNIARVILNGKDLGVVWTAPWQVEITDAVKQRENQVEIQVANLWVNRLIGDEAFPDDGIVNGQWPEWLLQGNPRTSGRYTFTTFRFYRADSPLMKSGLLGPVVILQETPSPG